MNRIRGGYVGRCLHVDLSDGSLRTERLDENFARLYIGGRGFTARMQYDLIAPTVDPLGPDNVFIIAPGPLTGTPVASTSRFTVGARSPLTGILGDANSGGMWGAVLKRAGYDMVVLRGRAPNPVYLWIDGDQVAVRDARHLWGMDTRQTWDTLKAELGRAVSIACIGPAGENLVRFSGLVENTEHVAARSGMGTVLGSKNVKALAVRGTGAVPLTEPGAFKELSDQLAEILRKDKRSSSELLEYGTTYLMNHHGAIGCLNTNNYTGGDFAGQDDIDGDALNESYFVKATACYRCPCRCDRYSEVTEGEYAGTKVGGPEYATVAAFGSGCGNSNLASILKANELCNLYGLDSIETGNLVAFSMELYERGIITDSDTGNLQLTWGNHQSMVKLVEQIAYRQGFGDVLADGIVAATKKIGRNSERYAVHVKGMTPPGPDARAIKVYNFRYAVSPRGADHLRISAPGAYGLDSIPLVEAAEKLRFWEGIVTLPDLMGLCKFPYSYFAETVERTLTKMMEILPRLYTAATGLQTTAEDLLTAAERVNNVERAHNVRLGLSADADTMPPRFTEDRIPSGPSKGAIYDILEPMKVAWYRVHGWDEVSGHPRREKLVELGLADLAADLEERGISLT
jgi:aldehyde:ferredoxin oxidoreductase